MEVVIEEDGYLPKRAHEDDAGIDFRSPKSFMIFPHDAVIVNLKVKVSIPLGYYGKMESKSGLMIKHGIICLGGVIDSGFRGNIVVRMYNTSNVPYKVEAGDKLVQMVLIPVLLDKVHQKPALDPSPLGRNENGYGSTGK